MRRSGDGDNQTGEDPNLVELGGPLRSTFGIIGLAGHEVFDSPLGGRERLALFVAIHDPDASGSLGLARLSLGYGNHRWIEPTGWGAARKLQSDIIETLKLDAFPHAAY